MLKTGKTIKIFDFDDTLVKVDHQILVNHSDGSYTSLTPSKFANYEPRPGDTYDFSDFSGLLKNPTIIEKNFKHLKREVERSGRTSGLKVTVLTARNIAYPVKKFFRDHGIDVYVVALQARTTKDKANWIEKKINEGYRNIYFIDDCEKNIKEATKLKNKYPNIDIKVELA